MRKRQGPQVRMESEAKELEKNLVMMDSVKTAAASTASTSTPTTSQSSGRSSTVSSNHRAPSSNQRKEGEGRGDGRVGGWTNRGSLVGKTASVTRGNFKSKFGTVKVN